jgi:hypothetical protein
MINWTGPALMIAGAILVVFCASVLACHQQRRLAATQTQPDNCSRLAATQPQPDNRSSVIGGLEAARIGPEYYCSCL